jgi:hypothetical protein
VSQPDASRSPRGDGVKVVARGGVRKSVWLVAGACALLSLALLILFRLGGDGHDAPSPEPEPPRQVAAAPAPAEDRDAAKVEAPKRRVKPVEVKPDAPADEEPPAREDAPFSIGPPGSGIALFPPRDTKPIKIGIVVPEDFEVPEGYVRHYQATDDGAMLPAILMFHPDYEWVDDDGNRVELPADRVVPADMAPPGLPIEMLALPEKQDGAR